MSDAELGEVLGPARLAYFTPVPEYPIIADRKASFLLAASGLMTAVLLFFIQPLGALVRGPRLALAVGVAIALLLIIALLLMAVLFAFRGYVHPMPDMPTSMAFFRHVAPLDRDAYLRTVHGRSHRQAMRDALNYNYSCAVQAAMKFRLVNRALRLMRAAILLFIGVLTVLALFGR
jgi:hypothetical protein